MSGMADPLVSVLLPVRDAEATIERAVRSVSMQTHRSVELVLVDDGSRDDGIAKARDAWGDRGPIRLVRTGGRGLVAALRAGWRAASADFVARMDADDEMHPRRLERQVAFLDAHPHHAGVGSRVEIVADGRVTDGLKRYEAWLNALLSPEDIRREAFVESPIVHPSVLLRREAVDAAGGYRDRGWAEDYDLWLRLLREGPRLGKVPEVLLRWWDHPTRTSRVHEAYAGSAFLRCKAHHLARWPEVRGRAIVLWGAGRVGRRFARRLREEGVVLRAFVDIDPRKIGRSFDGTRVLGPDALGGLRPSPLVACVGVHGARDTIRQAAADAGYVEGVDFFCAA